MAEMVRLGLFTNPVEAELAKNHLQALGIPAFLAGEASGTLFAGFGSLIRIELYVAAEHAEEAEALLAHQEAPEVPEEEFEHDPDTEAAITKKEPPQLDLESGQPTTTSPLRAGAPPPDQSVSDDDIDEFPTDEADEADADRSITWTGERFAARAFLASVLGLLVLPPLLHVYSLWLLIRMTSLPEEPSPAGMRKVYAALVIDILAIASFGPFWSFFCLGPLFR